MEVSSYQEAPADYMLGRGDSIVINLYGASQLQIAERINADGVVVIPMIGPVDLQWQTLESAKKKLKSAMALRYADSDVSISLAEPRKIEVTIRGEVARPGKHLVHGYSTLTNVLHRAGGLTGEGSMRNVRLRSGCLMSEIDLYNNLLISGEPNDPRLKDGDVILVPAADRLVQLEGLVKRPAIYEPKEKQTLGELIAYAGGITEEDVMVRVRHRGAESNRIETMDLEHAAAYQPADGDIVTVEKVPDMPNEVVEVRGNVQHAGKYRLDESSRKLADILKIATPIVGNKKNIVVVYRDSVLVQVGDAPLELQGREEIFVEQAVVHVGGEVLHATDVDFATGKAVKAYIEEAGGYSRKASRRHVYIVSPDGRVHRELKKTRIVPGSQIIVPRR